MRRDIGAVVALIVLAALFGGCTGEGIKKSGDVVAVVNGKEVTTEDIKKRLGQAAPKMGEILADEQTRKELMDDIIATELISGDAKKKGLDRDQDYLLKVEDFKRNEIRNTYLNKEVIEKNTVSETELTDYIKKNEDAIKTEVTAGHILVKTEAEAKDALARLAKGENFAKLAAAISLDTRNNKTGGGLGPINIKDIPAEALELEKLVLSLKVGESGILKGRFGYSVIKVNSKMVNKKITIDNELQLRLHDKLIKLKRQNALDDRVKELRSKAKVVINDEVLKKAAGTPKGAEGKK